MSDMEHCSRCGGFLETIQYPASECEAEVCTDCGEEYNYRKIEPKEDRNEKNI